MNVKRNDTILSCKFSKQFEELYVHLRSEEKRIYSDEEVAWLPDVEEDHIHKREWTIRQASCKKLTRYLRNKRRPLKILEVGCGNGWLSYHLSQLPHSNVLGIDVNLLELSQGERVFGAISNLRFLHGDLNSSLVELQKFDVIVFAASIQYFKFFHEVIQSALDLLNEKGEIHILDSHFYYETEIEAARQRSREYFHSKGFDCMSDFYFHHSLKELDEFHCSILYDPNSSINKFLKRKNSFHWICIRK